MDSRTDTFVDLGLSEKMLSAISSLGYAEPFEIQMKAIPAIMKGRDVIGKAETGSGKTASYVIPIMESFNAKKDNRSKHLKVLVLVPTRELAMQVGEVFGNFEKNWGVKNLPVYGGVPINQQMVRLMDTEILIATPGRLLDLIGINSIHLGKIETLVIDEADKMLDMGFELEMKDILRLLPGGRQNILFSATIDEKLMLLHKPFLKNAIEIHVEPAELNLDLIEQTAYIVKAEEKGPALRQLILDENLEQVLVFVSSSRTADNLCAKLVKNGIHAAAMHSKKTQAARTQALAGFKNKKIRVLVATDIASRGIDIEDLPVVVNYELPRSPKDYIHRIGRTGRAGKSGRAITLITMEEEPHFYIIQKKMGKKVKKIEL